MKPAGFRSGMTLAETMIAVSVLAIVMTAVGTSFITAQRMLKEAMGLSELSLAAREMREKILFHASPSSDGTSYAGLLSASFSSASGTPINSSGSKITMEVCSMSGNSLSDLSESTSPVEIELKTSGDGGKHYLCNNKISNAGSAARWLRPSGTSVLNSSMNEMVSFDMAGQVNSTTFSSSQNAIRINLDFAITSNAKNPDGSPMIRRERIVVPVFGIIQPLNITSSDGKAYW